MDYGATPIQPLVEGLVTFDTFSNPVFTGHGVSAIARGALPAGDFILTLDVGVPGNAGAVQATPEHLTPALPANPDPRTFITVRDTASPPVSPVVFQSVNYLTSATPGVGSTQIEVSFATAAAAVDPTAFEIVMWAGLTQ